MRFVWERMKLVVEPTGVLGWLRPCVAVSTWPASEWA